jgi:hypothetical protein
LTHRAAREETPIRLGVSSCLLGQHVRYDGGHKRDAYIGDVLGVPLTLIRHHARANGVAYLRGQTWLEPHPRELMLRNQV